MLLGLLLVGCGASGPVIDQRSASIRVTDPALAALPEGHRVFSGDTLYSIAFRYGLDWRRVAAWNGIGAPYVIRVGQWVQLRPPPGWAGAAVPTAPKPAAQGAGTAERAEPRSEARAGSSRATPPATVRSRPAPASVRPTTPPNAGSATAGPAPSAAPSNSTGSGSAAPSTTVSTAPSRETAGVRWSWPTDGSLIRAFNANDARKGVLIGGQVGQAVVAAADGEVVYSGNGLIGYGELVIIKHSDRMLSAYAHNQQRLVAEGDRVRAGQPIAQMGLNEDNREVLHFEIRRDGKPEDPARYLPPKD